MIKNIRLLKNKIKKLRDKLESKSIPNKKSVGGSSYWTLDISSLNENSIIISGGVGNDISFEMDLINLTGCKIYLFDPSPTGIKTIEKIKNIPQELNFIPKGLGGNSGKEFFSFPENPLEGSFTIQRDTVKQKLEFPIVSITEFCEEQNINTVDCVKLDIEGFEYEVLEDILNNSKLTVHQILVEFHHFFEQIPKSKTSLAMKKLKKAGYMKIHRNEVDYSYKLQR